MLYADLAGVVVDMYGLHVTKWIRVPDGTSGGSCGDVKFPNGMGPLQGQSTKWEERIRWHT